MKICFSEAHCCGVVSPINGPLNVFHVRSGFVRVLGDLILHDDVIKWKHFPRYWNFVRGIHRSPVDSPYKGQWRGALTFSLIGTWANGWVNNRDAGDLRRHRAYYDITVMCVSCLYYKIFLSFNAAYGLLTCIESLSVAWNELERGNNLRNPYTVKHLIQVAPLWELNCW